MDSVGLTVAFVAGVLSFLSPCVLPLVPSYVSFITGLSLDEMGSRRWTALTHALLFVSGFTLIFLGLGAGATQLGAFLKSQQVWLERIGVFDRERRVHLQDKPVGYLGSVLVGLAFGAGWTPCIGPILGAILTFTAAKASLSEGMVLLLAYSLGLAVPFIVAALAVDRFIEWFRQFRRHIGIVMKVSGVLMVIFGIMLMTGTFTLLATYLQGLTPDFLRERI
jgi:cytochrome c-type biogenesis protein